MREMVIRIRFTQPCLGNIKVRKTVSAGRGLKKKRTFFVFQRDHLGRVIFQQGAWRSLLRKAAETLCRHQQAVPEIHFALHVDGRPQPIPEKFFRRYYEPDKFSPHEAFLAGDDIGLSCVVPSSISDDDLWRLVALVGRYYGLSPYRGGEYGHFEVVSVVRVSPEAAEQKKSEESLDAADFEQLLPAEYTKATQLN